jgi:hypothetical protein
MGLITGLIFAQALPTHFANAQNLGDQIKFVSPISQQELSTGMTKLYGSNDSQKTMKLLEAIPNYRSRESSIPIAVACQAAQWLPLNENSGVVITSCSKNTYGNDCHACAPILGVLKFVRELDASKKDVWKYQTGTAFVGLYGSWGALPNTQIRKLGSGIESDAIELDAMDSGQGSEYHSLHLLDLGHGADKVNEIFYTPMASKNLGGCGSTTRILCYSWSSTLSVDESARGYGRITIVTTGTNTKRVAVKSPGLHQSKTRELLVKVHEKKTYCFSGSIYGGCGQE